MSDSSANLPQESSNPDAEDSLHVNRQTYQPDNFSQPRVKAVAPLKMVETAFLASTASLIWFINFYFPLGSLLRVFFPIPIALVYLRWGNRAAWMAALVSGLLLSVLMGPSRSLLFVMPYGLMGVLLGAIWQRRSPWIVSISLGTLLACFGIFFKLWLLSILAGEDMWVYTIIQVTNFAEWGFEKLGLLAQPSVFIIQAIAIAIIIVQQYVLLIYGTRGCLVASRPLGQPDSSSPSLGTSGSNAKK